MAIGINKQYMLVLLTLGIAILKIHMHMPCGLMMMATNAHCLQPINHLTGRERQAYRFKTLLIQERHQVQKVRLSPTNLSLPDNFQYLYLTHLTANIQVFIDFSKYVLQIYRKSVLLQNNIDYAEGQSDKMGYCFDFNDYHSHGNCLLVACTHILWRLE